jgi:hypothetical protein
MMHDLWIGYQAYFDQLPSPVSGAGGTKNTNLLCWIPPDGAYPTYHG